VLERPMIDRTRGGENPHGDRQVEACAGFLQTGRGEVYGDPPVWKFFANGRDRGPDSGGTLSHRGFGETHDVDPGQLGTDPHLDLDANTVYAA